MPCLQPHIWRHIEGVLPTVLRTDENMAALRAFRPQGGWPEAHKMGATPGPIGMAPDMIMI